MASRQGGGGSGGGISDTTVGNYRIGHEIGRGSFAVVFKGHHLTNKSLAAIKVVQRNKLSRKLLENLESEIQILKKLHHPHIVALPDCKKTDRYIHLIMEFCSVSDLSVIIKKRDRLTSVHPCFESIVRDYPSPPNGGLHEVLVRHFLKQLASALEFLRKDGLVHRDVKPQNLLLNPPPDYEEQMGSAGNMEGSIMLAGLRSLPVLKLADFGFARVLPAASMAETLCGSPLYMAPEILRYEKYDATADLWSVGTVLYEMSTGRPPFRAPNHVDLLRKIETRADRIDFPSACSASDPVRKLIRGLLKRNPVERMSFEEFFSHPVIVNEIPGTKPMPSAQSPYSTKESAPRISNEELRIPSSFKKSTDTRALGVDREERGQREGVPSPTRDSAPPVMESSSLPFASPMELPVGTPSPRPSAEHRRYTTQAASPTSPIRERATRPLMPAQAMTAPGREDLASHRRQGSAAMERIQSRGTDPSPGSSIQYERERQSEAAKDRRLTHRRGKNSRELRNSAEEDYVIVDKQQVAVNALADEVATARRGRVTPPPSTSNALQKLASSPRAITAIAGRRPDYANQSKGSYDLRYASSPSSQKSTLAKALELANQRLFGVGLSPPNHSPPNMQSPFPPYAGPGSLVLVGNVNVSEEDSTCIVAIEEAASRSDVVYNFAEVKYAQIMPSAPRDPSLSSPQGLGLVGAAGSASEADQTSDLQGFDLTPDAMVVAGEECLVLYVKTLSLLSKGTAVAHKWWKMTCERNEHERYREVQNPSRIAASTRMNGVIQWVRDRFNEVLGKAIVVQKNITEAQTMLPPNHPHHPSNHPYGSEVSLGSTGSSNFMLVTGVTAERLMYDRAVEMSRAAAVNELVGEDLVGCEAAYTTAFRLLEAVLEFPEDEVISLDPEDKAMIAKMLAHIRVRMKAIRKKIIDLSNMSKRSSVYSAHGSPHVGSHQPQPPSPAAASPSPSPNLR